MANKPEVRIEQERNEDGQVIYRILLSAELNEVQYQDQVKLAAQHRHVSEAEYLQRSMIFGLEKGLN